MATLAQRIASEEFSRPTVQINTPAELREIWERARRSERRLGTLCVCRGPLAPGLLGEYLPHSGDVWILWRDGEHVSEAIIRLLHEIAHADLPTERPRTIDEDWDREIAAWTRARELAVDWGYDRDLTEERLATEIDNCEVMRLRMTDAGSLAGSWDPIIARQAYNELEVFAFRARWTIAEFDEHLARIADDDRIVGFSRKGLRARWKLPYTTDEGFGRLAQAPEAHAYTLLRDTLQVIASTDDNPTFSLRHRFGQPLRIALLDLHDEIAFRRVIATLNYAFLKHAPGEALLGQWTIYGDSLDPSVSRLYHVLLTGDDPQQTLEIWVLVDSDYPSQVRCESALQIYIASWHEVQAISHAPLKDGLRRFFHDSLSH